MLCQELVGRCWEKLVLLGGLQLLKQDLSEMFKELAQYWLVMVEGLMLKER